MSLVAWWFVVGCYDLVPEPVEHLLGVAVLRLVISLHEACSWEYAGGEVGIWKALAAKLNAIKKLVSAVAEVGGAAHSVSSTTDQVAPVL